MSTPSLPVGRRFSWRALLILVLLQFLGNLAALPLLRATDMPVEPVSAWVLWTAVSVVVIGIGLYLGTRTGLGAPLLEGQLKRDKIPAWSKRVVAVSLLIASAGSLLILLLSLNANPEGYPPSWKLILASVDAGVQEENFSRLFLMTLFVWLGSLVSRQADGRPTQRVFWIAVILSAVLFGWSHIDDKLAEPAIQAFTLVIILAVNTMFGIIFGWLYWQLGLECAILAHFLIDALSSAVIMPAYLSGNLLVRVVVLIGLVLTMGGSLFVLVRSTSGTRA
jgi:hypothetical protein